jgi:radical SAM protein with 4Fe4S-binding SPASM domain
MKKNEFKILNLNYSRYLGYLKYMTFPKMINLMKSLYYWKTEREIINTAPAFLRVEISRKCSIDCLYCFQTKEDIFFPLDNFKKLVDKFKKYLLVVSLYEIGEPLENKDIVKYIEYVKSNKIGTIISTNLSVERDDNFWEDLVNSGLDRIIVAIDGITSETYNKYRRNGDLKLVIQNLKKIIYYNKVNNKNLEIEWQMVDFDWNKSEQAKAETYAYKLGCDEFRLIPNAYRKRLWKDRQEIRKTNCIHPYISLLVNAYNKVRPCPVVYNVDVEIGDLNKESVDQVWNGNEVRRIRNSKKIQHREGCKTCLAGA